MSKKVGQFYGHLSVCCGERYEVNQRRGGPCYRYNGSGLEYSDDASSDHRRGNFFVEPSVPPQFTVAAVLLVAIKPFRVRVRPFVKVGRGYLENMVYWLIGVN